MKLINLTPHHINIGATVIPPSGNVARCNTHTRDAGNILGIPVVETHVLSISGVPECQDDVGYIVPSVVRQNLPNRRDLYSPAKFMRDEHGHVKGCMSLEVNPK